jgi:hypothetical protein
VANMLMRGLLYFEGFIDAEHVAGRLAGEE